MFTIRTLYGSSAIVSSLVEEPRCSRARRARPTVSVGRDAEGGAWRTKREARALGHPKRSTAAEVPMREYLHHGVAG